MNRSTLIFVSLVIAVALIGAWLWQNTTEQQTSLSPNKSEMPPVMTLNNGDTYDLVAAPFQKTIAGNTQQMLAYNGSIPGPTIKVRQGSEVTIRLKNETTWPTSLHSHGVRVENAMDGAAPHTQDPVPPGGTFIYRLRFPDAGAFWYHPHVREDATQELGLYGMFIVEPTNDTYWNQVHRELPLVLDDLLMENGRIVPFSQTTVSHALMGRFGNVMLVNGEVDYRLSAKKNEVIRFFVLNAANTRPFHLTFRGAKMKLVGSDNGRSEHDEWIDSVLIGPSERMVVDVRFEAAGDTVIEHQTPKRTYALGRVRVAEEPVEKPISTFDTIRNTSSTLFPDRLSDWYDRDPDRMIRFDVDLGMMGRSSGMEGHMGMMGEHGGAGMMAPVPEGGIEWEQPTDPMNAMSTSRSIKWKLAEDATGRSNEQIDWIFKKDGYVKIRLLNDDTSAHPMQHPIHLHGQRFIVLTRNGRRDDNPVWKDTVLVKAGETVDILLEASNPGEWMLHCHIPEHLESGMMMTFQVQ